MDLNVSSTYRIAIVSLTLSVMVAAGGCEKESGLGGPGAPVNNSGSMTTDNSTENSANTFVLTVPASQIEITQGETKTISIGLERGSEFTQAVDVSLSTTASGLSITPTQINIASGQTNVEVVLTAAADANVGVAKIAATGKPQTGKSVMTNLDVEIQRKE